LDTSALVKYYHQEPGSQWVKQIVNAQNANDGTRVHEVYLADVSLAEVGAALAILARNKQITMRRRDVLYDAFLNDIESVFQLLPMTTDLAYMASELTQKYPLKGYDAVQLAVAQAFHALLTSQTLTLIFVSGDDQLLNAAKTEGLTTDNPFLHTDLD